MAIKAEGRALISRRTDGTLYEIDADDLEWEVIGSGQRSMGPEVLHRASIDHPELGEISWTISEYPAEVVNHVTPEISTNLLLEELVFWYEHEPDAEYYEAIDASAIEFSRKELQEVASERQKEMLVAWFRSRFEDPAQETPYNGREGGYQYVWGGPHEARDELEKNFSGIVNEKVIDDAVEEIESDGIHEWAPIRYGPPDDEDFHRPRTIVEYGQLLKAEVPTNVDDPAIVNAKADAVKSAEAFLDLLSALRPQHGRMGHNGPPVDEAGNILPPRFYDELEEAAETLQQALTKDDPDLTSVIEAGVVLERRLSWIIRPSLSSVKSSQIDAIDKKADAKPTKFTDEFKGQLGKNAANMVTNVAVAGLSLGGGFLLHAILPGLDVLVGSVLTYLSVKIKH